MKILHINLNYNQSTLYEQLSLHLIKHGSDTVVFYPAIKGEEIINTPNFLNQEVFLNRYDRYFYSFRNKKIVNYLKKNYNVKKYKVLHAHSLFSNGNIAYTLNRKYKIPYIVAVRNTDVNIFFKRMFHLRKKGIQILNNSSKIIFLSESYKQKVLYNYIPKHLWASFEEKIEIIPNGINPFWFENKLQLKLKKEHNKIRIISVGTINKGKNALKTAKACELFETKFNQSTELILIGEIVDNSYFNKVNSYPFVKHINFIDKTELIKYYRKADLFVLPSNTETFGLVYAEAMSQGLPVLYSKGEGFDKQFDDGVIGYPVNKHDIYDIADKMYLALQNRDRLSDNCIQQVGKFSWNKISKKYIEIYNNIVN